ncbi:GNAT family N-acetyltransferase [Vibrio sp. WJH972]
MIYQHINDSDVSETLDQQLRELLSLCFVSGNDEEIFKKQRYYNDMPQHRYMLWQGDELAAHIAVHEKQVIIDEQPSAICGIAEVCVHPKYRKLGLVKRLLKEVHLDRTQRGDAFSILFGDEEVYGSSGYQCIHNLKALNPNQEWTVTGHTMVLSLNKQWPSIEVKLVGIPF